MTAPPDVDRDSHEWWAAVARHELLLQRCTGCRTWRWPARAICGRCASFEWAWEPASRSASVASWTRNHHAFWPGAVVPYVAVLARLEEQPDLLLVTAWGPSAGVDPVIGQPVVVGFRDHAGDDGQTFALLVSAPADAP